MPLLILLFIVAILIFSFRSKEKKEPNVNKYPTSLLSIIRLAQATAIFEPLLVFGGLFLFDNPHGYKYIVAWILYVFFIMWAPLLYADYNWSLRLYDKYKSIKIAVLPQIGTYLLLILLFILWSL